MYWENRIGGHNSTGVTEPSKTWYLAEGSTGGSFETWVLVQNPGDETADIQFTFMTPDGEREGPSDQIPPGSRRTYNVADTLPGEYSVATSVTSTKDVVAERSVYWTAYGYPLFSPGIVARLDAALDEVMSESKIPGVVAGVWTPEKGTWIRARGKADVETGEDVEFIDKFRIGSVTKTFTATVVLQLCDEGELCLDDTLDEFFPWVPDSNRITIRQLLNMTSGLFEYGDDENLNKTIAEDPHRKWSPEELVRIAISHEPYCSPGEECHYSNTNSILQGMIVEKVTGRSLKEEIRDRISVPLGLEHTTFPDTPEITGEYSHGYAYVGQDDNVPPDPSDYIDLTEYLDPSIQWAAGAMISNLEDLKTWAVALAGGELLKHSTQEERLDWVDFPDGDGTFKYGLGIMYLGGLVGHQGMVPGYQCSMFYFPQEDTTIVVLANTSGSNAPTQRLSTQIARILFPDEFPW